MHLKPWHTWLYTTIFFGQFMLLWMTQVSLDNILKMVLIKLEGRTYKDSAEYKFEKTNDTTSHLHAYIFWKSSGDWGFLWLSIFLWEIHGALDYSCEALWIDFSSKVQFTKAANNFESSLETSFVDWLFFNVSSSWCFGIIVEYSNSGVNVPIFYFLF